MGVSMSDVFLSYASEDRARARVLAEGLEKCGLSVWWDRKTLPGESYSDIIKRELDAASCVVVLWSAAAVRSEWVEIEAARAKQRQALVPALLDDVAGELPLEFSRMQAASLVGWQGDRSNPEFQNLLAAIRRLTSRAGRATAGADEGGLSTAESEEQDSRRGAEAERGAEPRESDRRLRRHLWLSLAGAWAIVVAGFLVSLAAYEIREYNMFNRRGGELLFFAVALFVALLGLAFHGAFLGRLAARAERSTVTAFGWLAAPGCLAIYLYSCLFIQGTHTDGPGFPWPYYAHFNNSSASMAAWLVPMSILAFVALKRLRRP